MLNESFISRTFADLAIDGGTFVTVLGIFECAKLCMNTKSCLSFFYRDNMRSCDVSSVRFRGTRGLVPQAGSSYYSMGYGFGMQCMSEADCFFQNSVCRQGSCDCPLGYSYQALKRSCVKHCSEYGLDFSIYLRHVLKGNNKKSQINISPARCIEFCRDEATFVCITAEYDGKRRLCQMSDKAWFDVSDEERSNTTSAWILFHRHCAN